MPELPEVETIIQDLKESNLLNKKINNVKIRWAKSIATHSTAEFKDELISSKIKNFRRRAKYLVFNLSRDKILIIHLRMTGKIIFYPDNAPFKKHDRVIFHFDNGHQLRFNDTRKFGRIYLTNNPDDILGKLGPEPLDPDFTLADFKNILEGRSGMIKALLLNQSFIAGLGNIYTDEALWEAGIHPKQKANLISTRKQKKLYTAIKHVLKKGIKNKGTSLGSGLGNYARTNQEAGNNRKFLNVYQKDGEPCPRCGKKIKKTKVSQRSSHFCSNCQRQWSK
ncbi:MAG: DNA-formamidopyrimidine glycosylase [Candidatus Marinimicrobia bacterium]|nr:DNA-formamidopyrimidine glycosylase [Candidatus Neomarinimicrobiota bacterium]